MIPTLWLFYLVFSFCYALCLVPRQKQSCDSHPCHLALQHNVFFCYKALSLLGREYSHSSSWFCIIFHCLCTIAMVHSLWSAQAFSPSSSEHLPPALLFLVLVFQASQSLVPWPLRYTRIWGWGVACGQNILHFNNHMVHFICVRKYITTITKWWLLRYYYVWQG